MLTRLAAANHRRPWTLPRRPPPSENFATVTDNQQPSRNLTPFSSIILSPSSDPRNRAQTSAAIPAPAADVASLTSLILNSSNRQSLAQSLHSPAIQWCPELVNAVIKRLWNHGPKALEFFHLLTHHPSYAHHPSSYDHAIDISARLRDFRTLWTLVSRMRRAKIGPSLKTYAIIAERYASAKRPHKAVDIFLTMNDYGWFPDLKSFNALLDVLCKSKHVEMAYNLFKALRGKFKADCVSYNIIVNGWCLIKRTGKAVEVMKEMVDRGVSPNLTTYNTLVRGYFRAAQIEEGCKFFSEMKKRNWEVDVVTYTTVIHGLGVAGEINRSRNVFNRMVKEGVLPSVETYNAFIQVLCKKDSVANALLVFDEMVRKGYVPNTTTYAVVIRGLCHAGEFDKAMQFFGKTKDNSCCGPNLQTYNVMIRYLCDAGEIEEGLSLFRKMSSGHCLPNLDTYNILISAMFVRKKSDDLLLAGKLLMEMVDRGFVPRRFTFNRILNGLSLTGNHEFAREILRVQSKCGHVPRKVKL
ncbi:Pentatricopeptide repeat-containing protein At1g74900, mitochondrial [Linum grandiflorum]